MRSQSRPNLIVNVLPWIITTMSDDPKKNLGLSCPKGGTFYVCQDSDIRFIGCCDIDPCADSSGNCPVSKLHQAGFDAEKWDQIREQGCVTGFSTSLWYSCVVGPFLGCCKSNPCNQGGNCPSDDLSPARLSDDQKNATVFLPSSSSSTSSATSATSTTSTPSSATLSGQENQESASPEGSKDLPVGGIIGGTVGGVVFLILIACFLFLYKKRRADKEIHSAEDDQMEVAHPQWSPYKDTFTTSPSIGQAASPGMTPSTFGKASTMSRLSNSPSVSGSWTMRDSRHVSDMTNITNDWARDGQHTSLNTVSELDGNWVPAAGSPPIVHQRQQSPQYHELDSGSIPNTDRPH
ncbi:hypothetical protein F4779DRAFT_609215 [Xylariaceae sp. FL0662B]|nr:hypothetical protein F4779DRAFT_609215 [Xylariaceae sp. FL0662B]